ncbi:hypothetical protein PACTADRAFT_42870 [Pachysolen tannophilus NRRL Y-2460]|uniref:Domain of unknown function at the cortex 1 domain-containing protein n=1 Tax=Pachysolen tannophilus NRRL Y-2460 TaxID=669874 RepID=A0A1E4TUN6_PACTA|nr:hypothetical protein PACTADRAFT_42870 [Pachysolen tannophilus NRRL Y-2460]
MWSSTESQVSEQQNKYLKISASNSYDSNTFQLVPINTEIPVIIDSKIGEFKLYIRIRDFVGSKKFYNKSNSNYNCSYFDNENRNRANISLEIHFKPKMEINGNDLNFGNDFGHPIRDCLPYGTAAGMKLFKYLDPSATADIYSDQPFIYGKALSSFNIVNVKLEKQDFGKQDLKPKPIQENLYNIKTSDLEIPNDNIKRQNFFTSNNNLQNFTFLPGYEYKFDFFNNYITMRDSKFSLSLPGGFNLDLSNYLQNNSEVVKSVRWVIKKNVMDGIGVNFGDLGLVIQFELVDDNTTEYDDNIVKQDYITREELIVQQELTE